MTRSFRFTWLDVAIISFFVIYSILILYPFVYLLSLSFSTAEGIYASKSVLFLVPQGFSTDSYIRFLQSEYAMAGFTNTGFRTIVGTILSIFFTAVAAYPITKKEFPHRKFYIKYFLFPMLFSGGLIPSYLLINSLGLVNSRWVLVIPGLVSIWNMFIIKNFYSGIPASMEESAKIDGANDIQVFFKIIIPLSWAVIAVVFLWTVVYNLNSWFDALLYIRDMKKQVISVVIRKLIIEQSSMIMNDVLGDFVDTGDLPTPESMTAAAMLMTMLPVLALYLFVQKYFVKGITLGSVKE